MKSPVLYGFGIPPWPPRRIPVPDPVPCGEPGVPAAPLPGFAGSGPGVGVGVGAVVVVVAVAVVALAAEVRCHPLRWGA